MSGQSRSENLSKLPYKELSRAEDQHLKKQMYYFFPFLRQTYEAIRRQGKNKGIDTKVLSNFKNLACYYGFGLVFGEFNLKKEQNLIEQIFSKSGLRREELKKQVLSIGFNTYNKHDGSLNEYFFGDLPTNELSNVELPGGPDYNMGVSEGIAGFSQKNRVDLISQLVNFLKIDSKSPSIAILGNVARGVVDAACIYTGLQSIGVRSRFHFYRVSPSAFGDKAAVTLGEKFDKNSWGIAVDSLTVKGPSVPLGIDLLNRVGFQEKSYFVTFFGHHWVEELGVRFQWENRNGEDNYAGTLLGKKAK